MSFSARLLLRHTLKEPLYVRAFADEGFFCLFSVVPTAMTTSSTLSRLYGTALLPCCPFTPFLGRFLADVSKSIMLWTLAKFMACSWLTWPAVLMGSRRSLLLPTRNLWIRRNRKKLVCFFICSVGPPAGVECNSFLLFKFKLWVPLMDSGVCAFVDKLKPIWTAETPLRSLDTRRSCLPAQGLALLGHVLSYTLLFLSSSSSCYCYHEWVMGRQPN